MTDHNAQLAHTSGPSAKPKAIDMEEKFSSVTLDIIGQAVFNYEFHSVTDESPVVKAVYRTLREAEHRSTAFIPYWMLPGFSGEGAVLEGQREFARDLKLLDLKLDECINKVGTPSVCVVGAWGRVRVCEHACVCVSVCVGGGGEARRTTRVLFY